MKTQALVTVKSQLASFRACVLDASKGRPNVLHEVAWQGPRLYSRMNYLGRLGFEEQARSEVGPRSIEILERELHLDSSAKESLPVSWKRWRGRNVELEPSVAVAPKARELSGLTRPRLRQVEETLPKVVGNCPKCQKKTEMKDAKVTKFKNGANGYMSICSVYSRRMVKLGGYVGLGAVV